MRALVQFVAKLISEVGKKRPSTGKGALGRKGELLAAKYLQRLKYSIIALNWRSGRDEIDIVALDGKILVFIEVKTRTVDENADNAGRGYFAVDARKKKALQRACRSYLAGLRQPPAHFRFDVIEVKIHKNGSYNLQHHKCVPLLPKHFRPSSHA